MLRAARTLPYPPGALYALIADIDTYSSYLPYCTESRVTAWSEPVPTSDGASETRRWPRAGRLTVGYGPLSVSYLSRVHCVPKLGIVEAVSGPHGVSGLTRAERDLVAGGFEDGEGTGEGRFKGEGEMFESLVTRWTVKENEGSKGTGNVRSDVELRIGYRFTNPMYQATVGQVGEQVATLMVEAFEKRARDVLGRR